MPCKNHNWPFLFNEEPYKEKWRHEPKISTFAKEIVKPIRCRICKAAWEPGEKEPSHAV